MRAEGGFHGTIILKDDTADALRRRETHARRGPPRSFGEDGRQRIDSLARVRAKRACAPPELLAALPMGRKYFLEIRGARAVRPVTTRRCLVAKISATARFRLRATCAPLAPISSLRSAPYPDTDGFCDHDFFKLSLYALEESKLEFVG